jgi:hypothetical protein
LLADAGRQPLVRGQDDPGEEDVGLIHQRLAPIGANECQRFGIFAPALQCNGLIHLIDFFSDNGR